MSVSLVLPLATHELRPPIDQLVACPMQLSPQTELLHLNDFREPGLVYGSLAVGAWFYTDYVDHIAPPIVFHHYTTSPDTRILLPDDVISRGTLGTKTDIPVIYNFTTDKKELRQVAELIYGTWSVQETPPLPNDNHWTLRVFVKQNVPTDVIMQQLSTQSFAGGEVRKAAELRFSMKEWDTLLDGLREIFRDEPTALKIWHWFSN